MIYVSVHTHFFPLSAQLLRKQTTQLSLMYEKPKWVHYPKYKPIHTVILSSVNIDKTLVVTLAETSLTTDKHRYRR
jgi:hypothetical protein